MTLLYNIAIRHKSPADVLICKKARPTAVKSVKDGLYNPNIICVSFSYILRCQPTFIEFGKDGVMILKRGLKNGSQFCPILKKMNLITALQLFNE